MVTYTERRKKMLIIIKENVLNWDFRGLNCSLMAFVCITKVLSTSVFSTQKQRDLTDDLCDL